MKKSKQRDNPKEWEERLYEIIDDFEDNPSINANMRVYIVKLFSQEIAKAQETYFNEGYEKGRKAPMGVSQWKEHGKNYGYWDYLRDEVRKEMKEEIIEKVPEREYQHKDHIGWNNYSDGYNNALKIILTYLNEK